MDPFKLTTEAQAIFDLVFFSENVEKYCFKPEKDSYKDTVNLALWQLGKSDDPLIKCILRQAAKYLKREEYKIELELTQKTFDKMDIPKRIDKADQGESKPTSKLPRNADGQCVTFVQAGRETKNRRIYLNPIREELYGALIHELTHYVLDRAYDNNGMPDEEGEEDIHKTVGNLANTNLNPEVLVTGTTPLGMKSWDDFLGKIRSSNPGCAKSIESVLAGFRGYIPDDFPREVIPHMVEIVFYLAYHKIEYRSWADDKEAKNKAQNGYQDHLPFSDFVWYYNEKLRKGLDRDYPDRKKRGWE